MAEVLEGSGGCDAPEPCRVTGRMMATKEREMRGTTSAPSPFSWGPGYPAPHRPSHPSAFPPGPPPSLGPHTHRIPFITFAPFVTRGTHLPLQKRQDEGGPTRPLPTLSPRAPPSPRTLTLSPSSPEGPTAPGGPRSPRGPGIPSFPVGPGGPRSP